MNVGKAEIQGAITKWQLWSIKKVSGPGLPQKHQALQGGTKSSTQTATGIKNLSTQGHHRMSQS
jgi:hypothetical protein